MDLFVLENLSRRFDTTIFLSDRKVTLVANLLWTNERIFEFG
jgi:hypothetical protein